MEHEDFKFYGALCPFELSNHSYLRFCGELIDIKHGSKVGALIRGRSLAKSVSREVSIRPARLA